MTKLKPCPFCGGKATKIAAAVTRECRGYSGYHNYSHAITGCSECDFEITVEATEQQFEDYCDKLGVQVYEGDGNYLTKKSRNVMCKKLRKLLCDKWNKRA